MERSHGHYSAEISENRFIHELEVPAHFMYTDYILPIVNNTDAYIIFTPEEYEVIKGSIPPFDLVKGTDYHIGKQGKSGTYRVRFTRDSLAGFKSQLALPEERSAVLNAEERSYLDPHYQLLDTSTNPEAFAEIATSVLEVFQTTHEKTVIAALHQGIIAHESSHLGQVLELGNGVQMYKTIKQVTEASWHYVGQDLFDLLRNPLFRTIFNFQWNWNNLGIYKEVDAFYNQLTVSVDTAHKKVVAAMTTQFMLDKCRVFYEGGDSFLRYNIDAMRRSELHEVESHIIGLISLFTGHLDVYEYIKSASDAEIDNDLLNGMQLLMSEPDKFITQLNNNDFQYNTRQTLHAINANLEAIKRSPLFKLAVLRHSLPKVRRSKVS